MTGFTRTTSSLKAGHIEKKWIVIDAQNAIVGRLATFVAMRLRGKHRADYTPHADCGDHVVIINADKVKFTGRKLDQKTYYWHTGHPGGIKERTAGEILGGRFPERVLEKAVERMLPKESPLARKQMTHLKIYKTAEHPHEAQDPEVIDFAALNAKNVRAPPEHFASSHLLRNSGAGAIPLETPAETSAVALDLDDEFETQDETSMLSTAEVQSRLEFAILELDVADKTKSALLDIAHLLIQLDINDGLSIPLFRRLLRGLPDRLLRTLAEHLNSPETAKAAAITLAVTMDPFSYRNDLNEDRARIDFDRAVNATGLYSVSNVDVTAASEQAILKIRIWTQLPFTLAGSAPKLAAPPWESLSDARIQVSGANLISEVYEDERPEVAFSTSLSLTPLESPRAAKAVIYVRRGDNIVDHFVYDYSRLFPGHVTVAVS